MESSSGVSGLPFGDVLTPVGWRDIGTFKPGDPVFAVDADGVLVETTVSHVYQHDYDGEMIHTKARGLRIACTPGHRVAKLGGVKRQPLFLYPLFSAVRFADLPGQAVILRSVSWDGKPLHAFSPGEWPTRPRRLQQPTSLPGRSFARFLGWFLSEGCTSDSDKSFSIAQMKPANRARLKTCLENECGFIGSWDKAGVKVTAPDWWSYLRQFGKCREKFIPHWVKAGTQDDLVALFAALMDGDGHWETVGQSGTYFTTSQRLADDVTEVALKLGYLVCMSATERPDRDGLRYNIHVKHTKSGGTELLTGHHVYDVGTRTERASDIQYLPYEGPVCSLEIKDASAFMVRQHGSVWVSGDYGVPALFA